MKLQIPHAYHEFLRERILRSAGFGYRRLPPLDEMLKSERSVEFDELAINAKIIGAARYGLLGEPGKPKYDRISDMIRRLEEYIKDGNDQHLVDVRNLAECEFVEGEHPNKHLKFTDDTQHSKVVG